MVVTLHEVNFYKTQITRYFYIPFLIQREKPIIFTRSTWLSWECKSNSHLEILIGIKCKEFLKKFRGLRMWPGFQKCWALNRPLWRQYNPQVFISPTPVPKFRLASLTGGSDLTCPVKSLLNALLSWDFIDMRIDFLTSVTATCSLPPFFPLAFSLFFYILENLLSSLNIKNNSSRTCKINSWQLHNRNTHAVAMRC